MLKLEDRTRAARAAPDALFASLTKGDKIMRSLILASVVCAVFLA
jgi:hypothetical protein